MAKGAGKSKNSTITSKESNSTTKQPKQHKSKTTTSTTTTTSKPELETTTLPADLDLDGRSAYINNQYVPDAEEPLPDTSPPLYELLQQQMETVLSNTGSNIQVYNNDSPQMKESLDNVGSETQKPPGKPLFAYDLGQFDDYDEEEEGNEYVGEGDYIPDNCEDTQESLGDNDNVGGGYASNLPVLQHNYGQGNVENKPYDSSNYAPQVNTNSASLYSSQNPTKPNENQNNYNTQTNSNQGSNYVNNKPQNNYGSTLVTQQYNQHNINSKPAHKTSTKPKPSTTQNNYGQYQNPPQTNPTNNYGQYTQNNNQKPQTNQKPSNNQRPQYNSGKTTQNSYNTQKPSATGNSKPYSKTSQQNTKPIYNKPALALNNNKPSYGNNYPSTTSSNINYNFNNSESLTSAYGSFNPLTTSSSPYTTGQTHSLNPSLSPNFSYGSTNTENSSPFSTTSGYQGKYPNAQKRHLMFRTVSSSTQYVATPLADLMFKFSIGMAKPSKLANNNSVNNQAQVFNVLNDIDAKTE